jgi:hypothetical protein
MCLEKKTGEHFVILNLTDIQLTVSEIEFEAEIVRRAQKTINELIKDIKPDLITVTGDQCFGAKKALLFVGNLIDQYDIPWAPVFGNHDNQEDDITTAEQAYLYEHAFKNCLFKSGPNNLATVESGSVAYGNYLINIVEKDSTLRGFHVTESLVFMNSRDYLTYDQTQYGNEKPVNNHHYAMLSQKQIEWYKWAIQGVQNYGKTGQVKSGIFLHIPIYAYNLAFNAAFKTEVDMFDYEKYHDAIKFDDVLKSYSDKSIWNDGYENSVGECREGISSAPFDDHVLDAIKDFGNNLSTDFFSTDFVIAGHEHVNNFIIKYEGVSFIYGLKTGSGGYYDEDLSGGTVILVDDEGENVIYHKFTDIHIALFPWWIYLLIGLGCAFVVVAIIVLILTKCKKITLPKRK